MVPLVGRLFTVCDKSDPTFKVKILVLPAPVVPTIKWYWMPVPPSQENITELEVNVAPGTGEVMVAFIGAACV